MKKRLNNIIIFLIFFALFAYSAMRWDYVGGAPIGQVVIAPIAFRASIFPLIAYYDNTNDDLKIVACQNIFCTSTVITTADSMGNVGTYTSVARDSKIFQSSLTMMPLMVISKL